MKVIIVGCGKLGSGLALSLSKKGHSVTVIDVNAETFKLLGKNFKGNTIVGIGFDKDILEKARIRMADALIACSKSDDVNALVGRVARNIYRVPRVISRLYDPRSAEIYRSLGIQTISTTTWGVQQATEMLSYDQFDSLLQIGDVEIVRVEIPELLVGRAVNELTVYGEIQVVSIMRSNKAFMPTSGTIFQGHDILYIAVYSSSLGKLKKMLGTEAESEEYR